MVVESYEFCRNLWDLTLRKTNDFQSTYTNTVRELLKTEFITNKVYLKYHFLRR